MVQLPHILFAYRFIVGICASEEHTFKPHEFHAAFERPTTAAKDPQAFTTKFLSGHYLPGTNESQDRATVRRYELHFRVMMVHSRNDDD